MAEIPLASQIKCVEREIAMRKAVYPKRIATKAMKQETADYEIAAMEAVLEGLKVIAARPAIVCLCGSTRFTEAFRAANLSETMAGKIVLTVGCDTKSDLERFPDLNPYDFGKLKERLDDPHKRKIDLADEVLVLNVGGYVGESTRSEIEYAQAHGKLVRYLETVNGGNDEPIANNGA